MVVQTKKEGNVVTITLPEEFDVPIGVYYEAKQLPNGQIVFTPSSDLSQQSFLTDSEALKDVDDIFEAYHDIFEALVEK